jgi:hypothetical protein
LAKDPDIPGSVQRVLFEAEQGSIPLSWILDNKKIGSTENPVLWTMESGAHQLSLVDPAGQVVDQVEFLVRGTEEANGREPW